LGCEGEKEIRTGKGGGGSLSTGEERGEKNDRGRTKRNRKWVIGKNVTVCGGRAKEKQLGARAWGRGPQLGTRGEKRASMRESKTCLVSEEKEKKGEKGQVREKKEKYGEFG